MKHLKYVVAVLAIIALSGAMFYASPTLATEGRAAMKSLNGKFMWRTVWNGPIALTNTIANGMKANGMAMVKMDGNRLYDTSLKLNLSGFPPSTTAAAVYEVWLVDQGETAAPMAESNYALSIGAVVPPAKNQASLSYSAKMVNPKVYNRLVVTREPANDTDPKPSADVVFSADLSSFIFREISMKTTLLGRNEVPAVDTKASGTGKFIINTKDNTVTYSISFLGLSSAETAAHIHGPARPGANAGVLVELPKGNAITGVWTYDESMEMDLLRGRMYVNVHSEKYPNGEIRGQIVF